MRELKNVQLFFSNTRMYRKYCVLEDLIHALTVLAFSLSPVGSVSPVWVSPAPPAPRCRCQLPAAAGTQLRQALRGVLPGKACPRLSELVSAARATHQVLQRSAPETGVSGVFCRV